MKSSEFYNAISLINSHVNTVALINIQEFYRLKRINGEYQWIPLDIDSLPYIPILTSSFKENFRATKEIVNIRLTPVWKFLTNNESIITPKIETFELTEHTKKHPHYTLTIAKTVNPHYLSNSNWNTIFDKSLATRQNAVEWKKRSNSLLFNSINETALKNYLNYYQKQLAEFNEIYKQSAETAQELKTYQKKLR